MFDLKKFFSYLDKYMENKSLQPKNLDKPLPEVELKESCKGECGKCCQSTEAEETSVLQRLVSQKESLSQLESMIIEKHTQNKGYTVY